MRLVLLLFLVSCASKLPPSSERSFVKTIKNSSSKNDNFNSAIIYYTSTFKNSGKAIKLIDKDSGMIIVRGNVRCNKFRQMGDINNYLLQFTMTYTASSNKRKFKFEDLYISSVTGNPIGWSYNQISSKKKLQEAASCLKNMYRF